MSNLSNSQIRARIDKALIDKEQGNAAFKAGNNSKALALYHSVLLNLKGINNTERLPPVQILPPRQRVGTASPQPSSTQVARDIEGPRIVAVEEESAAAAAAAHVKVDNSGKETAANAASDDKNGGARDPSKHEQDDANDDDDDDGSSSEGSTDSNDSEEAIKPETLHTDLKKTMAAVYVNMSMVHAKNGNWVRCKATASEALVLDPKNTKASFRVAQATVRLGEVTKGRKMLLELQKAGDDTAIRNELKILREAEKARNEKSQGGMRGFINKANPTTPKIQEIIEDKKPAAKKEGKTMLPAPATAAAGSAVQTGTGTSKSGTLTPPQTPGKASSAQKMGRKEDGQGSGDVSMPLTPPKDA